MFAVLKASGDSNTKNDKGALPPLIFLDHNGSFSGIAFVLSAIKQGFVKEASV